MALPKTFALKSQYNNKYLAYIQEEGETNGLLKFSAEEMNKLTNFQMEPAMCGDGLVHIKSAFNKKYWRRSESYHYYIAAVADDPEEDQTKWSCTLFKPIFVDGDAKTLHLLHVQLGHLVSLWRKTGIYDNCLFAAKRTADKNKVDVFEINQVPDPGGEGGGDGNPDDSSGEITDVEFDTNNGKVYGLKTIELATGVAVNNDENSSGEKIVTLAYTKTESSTWKLVGNPLNTNVVTKIKAAVPVIVKENIVLSGDELTGHYKFGNTMQTSYVVKTTYTVILPPMTMVIVTLKATQASFDVPFSYTEVVTETDGTDKTHNRIDGIYTGESLINLRYETREEKVRVA